MPATAASPKTVPQAAWFHYQLPYSNVKDESRQLIFTISEEISMERPGSQRRREIIWLLAEFAVMRHCVGTEGVLKLLQTYGPRMRAVATG